MSRQSANAKHNEPALKHARQDYARLQVSQTVGEALEHVRRHPPEGRIVYFYVLDEEQRLRGVVPTRRLLLSPPKTPVADIMVQKLIAVPPSATVLDACEYFVLHRLLAFPIVDADRRVLGVIDIEMYTDEIADLAEREERDDVFQLIGVHVDQVRHAAVLPAFVRRFPWLLCNIAGGLVCAFVAGLYQDLLGQAVLLALFIPVVLALAESVSIQSLTLSLQSPHDRRPTLATLVRALARELGTGLLLGLASGVAVSVVAWLWRGQAGAAAAILLGITLAVLTAALLGLLLPRLLRALQHDPKVAAGPIVLATTDVAALLYYFNLAAWFLT